jgi:chromosome partitioning protein
MNEVAVVPPRAPFRRLMLAELKSLANSAKTLITKIRDGAIEPNRSKTLRGIPANEVCRYLGDITIDTLYRRLKKDPELPQGTQVTQRRREFTVDEIHALQRAFALTPKRPKGQPPITVSVCNFKGGVAKTTQTAHLAQYLCLMGYRVLVIDLDAQASLTQMFGILPHSEVLSNQTSRPFFEGPGNAENPNEDWTGTLATAVRKTHWPQLDLIPSNLGLYGAEFAIAARIRDSVLTKEAFYYYSVLKAGIDTVKDNYDIILLDTAPSLSFVNSNALFAADALLITLPPAPVDVQSASLFYELIANVIETFDSYEDYGKAFEFGAVLLTKFKPNDQNHQLVAGWIRTYLKDICTNSMVQTVVLEKLGVKLLSLYEADPTAESSRYEGDRRAFERAVESMNDVNREIEEAIQTVWTRKTMTPDQPGSPESTPEVLTHG